MPVDPADEMQSETIVTFRFEVEMIRMVGSHLMPSIIEITSDIDILDGTDDEDAEVAMMKVRYWFDTYVTRCIAFAASNAAAAAMFLDENGVNRTGNNFMATPLEPSDQHLSAIFQAKMNALGDGKMLFSHIQIRSNNADGMTFTFVGDPSDVLPEFSDWIEQTYYFDQAWWDRDDASMIDIIPGEGVDLTVRPNWAKTMDFLRDTMKPVTAGEVIRPNFKPKIIEGGRKDDE